MTPEFRADLHCHSTCSDGTKTPEQLLNIAKEIGLSALSITDHDTKEAYAVAIPFAKELGISLIPGIELSAHLDGISVHILGYGFDLESPSINELCQWHTQRRKDRNLAILDRLAKHGMQITYEEIETSIPVEYKSYPRTIGRPHIAFAMVHKKYVANTQEAFNKYLAEGKSCFVRGDTYGVKDTIAAIHKARGIAVIAHPHLIKNTKLLNELLSMDFDGIECFYGKFHPYNHERWLKIAKKKNWLVTGGSDFHGEAKPNITLGCSWIGNEHFQSLLDSLKIVHAT